MSTGNAAPIEQLPDEVLFDILLRLDIPELHALSQVTPDKVLAILMPTRHPIVSADLQQILISMKSAFVNTVRPE
jgi:hypothetical protein